MDFEDFSVYLQQMGHFALIKIDSFSIKMLSCYLRSQSDGYFYIVRFVSNVQRECAKDRLCFDVGNSNR